LVASTKYENLAKAAAAAQVTGDVEVIILDSLDIDELLKDPLNIEINIFVKLVWSIHGTDTF
jgi:DUF4097 and DUF4098 domain-containing protein YvlB